MIVYRTNCLTQNQIYNTLLRASGLFNPPLNQQSNLVEWAAKLRNNATTFEAYDETGKFAAMVAVYMNNPANKTAFIPIVLCMPEFQRRGITTEMMMRIFAVTRDAGFLRICLETGTDNTASMAMYKKLGFTITNIGHKAKLEKQL